MAKFIITLSDKNGGIDLCANCYGNEKMNPATPAQDAGCVMIAYFRSVLDKANNVPWWKRLWRKHFVKI